MFYFAIFSCVLISGIVGQVPFFGSCPNVETMENFKLEKYMGKWYEYGKYFAAFQYGGKCVTADYELTDSGVVSVKNQEINTITGKTDTIEGEACYAGSVDEAKFKVRFPSVGQVDAPYWVVNSDYENYSIVWACLNVGPLNMRNAWILTRQPFPSNETLQNIQEDLSKQSIASEYFIKTDHENCPM